MSHKAPARGHSVTIKDLASELDLSITTISRALNGYPDVGEKTRQRVVEAARTLGYRPNRNAQRLVTRRTHNLAWVQSDDERKIVDPHFQEVMAGVLRAARLGEYDIIMSSETTGRQVQAYDRYLRENSVDGFIVDLPAPKDPRITFLMEAGKPFVVHGRESRSRHYGWVDIDNFGNFYRLTRMLIANGHTHLAFINGDEQFSFARERRKGVEAALEDAEVGKGSVRVFTAGHPMGEAGFQLTTDALRSGEVTAILYSSTLMALEGLPAILRAGRHPGENVVIASMDDGLRYLDLSPFGGQISVVRSSLRDAGMALANELIRQCNGNPPRGTLIGSSFRPAPGISGATLEDPVPSHRM